MEGYEPVITRHGYISQQEIHSITQWVIHTYLSTVAVTHGRNSLTWMVGSTAQATEPSRSLGKPSRLTRERSRLTRQRLSSTCGYVVEKPVNNS